MNDMLSLIREIVREELQATRLADIAVVSSVFPHTGDDDTHNYECNVKLREDELELRKVPIATPHIGMVSVPKEGDLVLINYVNGDPNRAVIVGRLYHDKANPPKHEPDEWRVESPHKGVSSLAIDKEGSLVLTAGKTILTLKKDGDLDIQGEADVNITTKGKVQLKGDADLKIEVKGKVELKCTDCTVDASGSIELGKGGSGVITEKSHRCYFTGQALVPSQKVKAM